LELCGPSVPRRSGRLRRRRRLDTSPVCKRRWPGGGRVDAGVEFGHVVVQMGLTDLGVRCENVWDKRAEVNTVKSFSWIVKDGVLDVINGGGKLVASDGQYEPEGCPHYARGDVSGS
jgi:hypothetical protein